MPTYEYQCKKCKKKFDHFQSITADPIKKCIHCKGPVQRLISAGAGLIFKGSGFYATDYKKSSGASSSKSPKSSAGCPKAKKGDKGCAACPAAGGKD